MDHGVQYGLVQDRLREMQVVRADGRAPLRVVGAPVEVAPTAAVVTAHGDDWPATRGTAGESTQEIRRRWRQLRQGLRLGQGPDLGNKDARPPAESRMRGLPEVIRDDPALRQVNVNEVCGRPRLLRLGPPPVGLFGAIPEAPA